MAVFKTLSLNQPTLQLRESNIGDKKLFSELRTLVRDISKQFTVISSTLEIEDWHEVGATGEPAFENSWVNFGSSATVAAFYKDPFGMVHIKGQVAGGTLDASIFTLPTGYRPSENYRFATMQSSTGSVRLVVQTDGSVHTGGATVNTSQTINCSFRL